MKTIRRLTTIELEAALRGLGAECAHHLSTCAADHRRFGCEAFEEMRDLLDELLAELMRRHERDARELDRLAEEGA